jgi:hypothetical protein
MTMVGDRDDEHRVRQAPGEHAAGQSFRAAGCRPLAHPDRHHPRRQQQHVAALEVLQRGVVELLGAGEARVVGVDGRGDRALPVPGGHRERGDRHLVAHPHRGVAREQQVGQRGDDEVTALHELPGQAAGPGQLVVRQPGDERAGEVLGREIGQVGGRGAPEGGAQPRVVDGGGDQLAAGRGVGEDLGQQPVQVQHLHTAGGELGGEGVVLLLRPVDPRDPVEQQLVVVPGGQPAQLRTRPVQQNRAQPAHLAGGAHPRGRLDHAQRLAQVPGAAPASPAEPPG